MREGCKEKFGEKWSWNRKRAKGGRTERERGLKENGKEIDRENERGQKESERAEKDKKKECSRKRLRKVDEQKEN